MNKKNKLREIKKKKKKNIKYNYKIIITIINLENKYIYLLL